MFFRSVLATTMIAAAMFAPEAHANLVTNGSFEQTSLTAKGTFEGNVTGWSGGARLTFLDFPGTADDGSYLSVYPGFPTTSPDGGNFVEADGDPNYSGAFSQAISGLTAGQRYTLTFYQAAGQQYGYTGPTTERWSVSFGDETQLSSLFSLAQAETAPWQAQSLTFVASAVSQVLTFLAVGTPLGAPPISFLDGVNLEASAVPEPATLAILGVGLIGLTIAARRRRQRA